MKGSGLGFMSKGKNSSTGTSQTATLAPPGHSTGLRSGRKEAP